MNRHIVLACLAAMAFRPAFGAVEVNGVVSVEAERFTSQSGYGRYANSGASGGAVMRADGGTGSRLNFQIDIRTPGTWYFWMRAYATADVNNGCQLGLDGQTKGDIYLKKVGWSWLPEWLTGHSHAGPITLQLTAGRHTLSIIKRKVENPLIDKIVLTRSARPPTGYGPAQTATVTPPKPPPAKITLSASQIVIPFEGAPSCPLRISASSSALAWTASANAAWIKIATKSGRGSGLITYGVSRNTRAFRVGRIYVKAGSLTRTFIVYQLGNNVAAIPADFDGDVKADLAAFRPTDAYWNLLTSRGKRVILKYGWASLVPVPADYDGDGKVDPALYHRASGKWYIRNSSGGQRTEGFGWSATVPVPADYDGDGVADLAVFHPAKGQWHFKYSSGQPGAIVTFGNWASMLPLPADYDGDGIADLGLYHPPSGRWFYCESSTGIVVTRDWGWKTAIPVPADYDGDGAVDIAVFDRTRANWHILYRAGGRRTLQFGWSNVIPVPADYDGDGQDDLAIYNKKTAEWYVHSSASRRTTVRKAGGPAYNPVLLNHTICSWYRLL